MIRTSSLALAALVALSAVDAASLEAQTTFEACRVPDVGAIYMINVAGAPSACLDASHVAFSWTEGGVPGAGTITSNEIADGTIVEVDIAVDGVTGANIAPAAVGSTEILDGSINPVDLGFDYTVPPSGTTIQGTYGADITAAGASERVVASFSFGVTLPSEPIAVFIPVSGAPPAGCSGTPTDPGADPGYLCVFEQSEGNRNLPCVLKLGGSYACGQSNAYGSGVYFTSIAAGNFRSIGTWAVTVP